MPLTARQKKLDVTRDGKITREDLMILRKSKRGKKKNGKTQSQSDKNFEETFKASFQKAHGYDEKANA